MRIKDIFNKKVKLEKDEAMGGGFGKSDKHAAAKVFVFMPIAIMLSALIIIAAVFGVPKTMDLFKGALDSVYGNHEEIKKSAEEVLFDDVKADSKYYDSLVYLKKNGVINGYDDHTFRPDQTLKRADLVKVIVSAKKQFPLALNYNNCFKDVKNEWFAASVCLAKDKGWIGGKIDGKFHPEDDVSRAEGLKMLIGAFDVKRVSDKVIDNYEDVKADDWFYADLEIALERGILNDNPTLEFFKPNEPLTRGDAAQMLYRILQL